MCVCVGRARSFSLASCRRTDSIHDTHREPHGRTLSDWLVLSLRGERVGGVVGWGASREVAPGDVTARALSLALVSTGERPSCPCGFLPTRPALYVSLYTVWVCVCVPLGFVSSLLALLAWRYGASPPRIGAGSRHGDCSGGMIGASWMIDRIFERLTGGNLKLRTRWVETLGNWRVCRWMAGVIGE